MQKIYQKKGAKRFKMKVKANWPYRGVSKDKIYEVIGEDETSYDLSGGIFEVHVPKLYCVLYDEDKKSKPIK